MAGVSGYGDEYRMPVDRMVGEFREAHARRLARVDRCPHCHEACGALTLLTSMVRYYQCVRCSRSWHVNRNSDERGGRSLPVGAAVASHSR